MNNLIIDNWHIEISSICALKCPRCPRQEIPETLKNKQLDLNFFINQIGEPNIRNIRQILFCGNDGDPIYCKEFLEICEFLKKTKNNINLRIVTNGSYKTKSWWYDLSQILNEYDEITWSIDGIDNSMNIKYRINSDYESIMEGINEFFSNNDKTFRVWGIIPFKFNENHIDTIKKCAIDKGFDQYRITKSNKFGSFNNIFLDKNNIDNLQPVNNNLISTSNKYEVNLINLTNKKRPINQQLYNIRRKNLTLNNKNKSCLVGDIGVFLNSMGHFYPCCWSGTRNQINSYWHKLAQTRFNLQNRKLDEILSDDFWKTDFLKFDSEICKFKCS